MDARENKLIKKHSGNFAKMGGEKKNFKKGKDMLNFFNGWKKYVNKIWVVPGIGFHESNP